MILRFFLYALVVCMSPPPELSIYIYYYPLLSYCLLFSIEFWEVFFFIRCIVRKIFFHPGHHSSNCCFLWGAFYFIYILVFCVLRIFFKKLLLIPMSWIIFLFSSSTMSLIYFDLTCLITSKGGLLYSMSVTIPFS